MDQLKNSSVNEQRINYVQQCFGASGVPLTAKGRVLVGEGVLTKLCRKKPKQRQFFLFNDLLVYGTIVIHKKVFKNQHVMELINIKIENIPESRNTGIFDDDDNELKYGWLISSPVKSFAVYAQTKTEKIEWMTHMSRCIEKLRENSTSLADIETAPTWVPDSDATVCMRCSSTRFTPLQRKHHCRKCGFVVCGSCSTKKLLLKEQSDKPVRVCDSCFLNFNF